MSRTVCITIFRLCLSNTAVLKHCNTPSVQRSAARLSPYRCSIHPRSSRFSHSRPFIHSHTPPPSTPYTNSLKPPPPLPCTGHHTRPSRCTARHPLHLHSHTLASQSHTVHSYTHSGTTYHRTRDKLSHHHTTATTTATTAASTSHHVLCFKQPAHCLHSPLPPSPSPRPCPFISVPPQ